ncbi:ornithine carbamoyltransferase [Clostridium tetanomorphum]|uniref:Ornithine carbamoyltransferase n=1 Tax=Clostridium tetanomorphum TaxID=1553 RepID=A0A923EE58_CLOTT|nr:ornithine carbamoyltransferase [Clostridium tetanomorphum]KAJ52813.1 ornithine carbamoyltransferase [Clostridium tetanomorphum DSM 665]MBC2399200.1 ornithine carbamoyltransferase [Clostridium tetanomorphum]MBP1865398.1 ornithine carbamoyltransferase [Clostridium tetanomorphum]NRS84835.1 ornithine carbamoyltransferase [Clostridium tetanomorphum]NRZ98052.1 ornithine carbamoyltransferase [Clostridium tetanomorphum]
MINLKNRNCLTLKDFSLEEIEHLLDLAQKLKKQKKEGNEDKLLTGKNIALIFEKESLRTRCSFEVAAYDQGANITYINSNGSHMGKKESIKDTGRILGRMFDGIEYRGYSQKAVEILAEFSKVPVWNGLTDEDHPTQVLADFLTLRETINKSLSSIKFVYIGDGRNNVANALMIGASKVGMNFKIISPRELFPKQSLIEECIKEAEKQGGKITITENIEEIKGADVIYTDVWVSMGEEERIWEKRIEKLLPYQVNMKLLKISDNENVKFMHCLPAYHNLETEIGGKIYDKFGLKSLEVTEEVFESKYSLVFEQGENRLHTIKAVMVATLM